MSIRTRFVQTYRRHQVWFKTSDEVLGILFSARGGGTIAMGLAAFSAVGLAMETLYPADDGYTLMKDMGFHDPDLTIGGFLCEIMHKRMPNETIAVSQWGTSTHLWRREDGTPLAGGMFNGPKYADGPLVATGTLEEVYAATRKCVWAEANEIQLDVVKSGEGTWRGSGRFHLREMHALGPYLSKKEPSWYADRLALFPKGTPLTTLLRGPTGAGKSVLARHIAKLLRPNDSRVLKVSSEVLKKCRSDEVKNLVQWLQPTVLLLDDLDLDSNSQFFLDLLESLRDPNTLVIVTKMTKFADKEDPKPGCWHFPGMRPGRIDLIFTLGPPDKVERGWIFDHYAKAYSTSFTKALRKRLVKKTEGLTGAYLDLITLRLATLGVKTWEDEVNQVLYAAPFEDAEEEEDDKDKKKGGKDKAMADDESPKAVEPR